MTVRALRGATQVDVDEVDHVLRRTRELVTELVDLNELDGDTVISMIFSATPDIRSIAPAAAARQLGLTDTALLCVTEMPVDGSMPRVVRIIAHVETGLPKEKLRNVYHHGTDALRAEVPPIR